MKKLITFLCLFIIACSTIVTGRAQTREEIEIIATSSSKGLLRSAPAPAVSAWLIGAQIDLTFLRDLGTVTITVANAQEPVYSATVTAEEGTQTAISTQNWSAGKLYHYHCTQQWAAVYRRL
jgi:hypothetical protein